VKSIKGVFFGAISVIGALLMFIIRSKNKTITKQKEEIKRHKTEEAKLKYIQEEEVRAKHVKNDISSGSLDAKRVLEQTNSYRD